MPLDPEDQSIEIVQGSPINLHDACRARVAELEAAIHYHPECWKALNRSEDPGDGFTEGEQPRGVAVNRYGEPIHNDIYTIDPDKIVPVDLPATPITYA